jgi:ParB-like chromosome segregation protein Spo0J
MNEKLEVITIGDVEFTMPCSDRLPATSEDEYQRLSHSIASDGIEVSIIVDENMEIIDGVDRLKAAQEHGQKNITVDIRPGLTLTEKKHLRIKLNTQRRHLSRDDKKALAVELREDGLSLRQIAEIINVSPATVSRMLGTVSDETVEFPDMVTGKDGKQHPAKCKTKRIIAKDITEAKKGFEACEGLDPVNLPNKTIDVKRAARIKRNVEADEKRKEDYSDYKSGQAELLLGDFMVKGNEIEDESIDMIFTDPPYSKDALPLWSDLGEFANRVLKPGGLMLSYSGTMYLPLIHNMLGSHLEYFWTFAIKHSGDTTYVPKVNVNQLWKPVLGYCKPPFNKYWRPFPDMVAGQKSKEHHDWEQSVIEAVHYIKALCPKDGVLLDPMMGSATTLVAGLSLGIKCIGIEIDKAAYSTAEDRIKNTLKELSENVKGNVA